MNTFLDSLEDKLTVMEEEMQNLPEELDSAVAHLDRSKLRSLWFRLDQDFNKLLDQLFAPQRMNALLSPLILFPDGLGGPLCRQITEEDLARWRDAHKSEIRVAAGKGGVTVIAISELAGEYKKAVSQIILAAQQQGYIVLDWEQYQKLLDEIGKLIGEDDEQGKATFHETTVIGIPVTTTDSQQEQEVKMLPKSPPS